MKTKLSALALAALLFAGLPQASTSAYVAVSVGIAPPAIPIYEQPYCPAPGYIWTPGYWAWGDFGYYWVPGVWVLPPAIGLLWTPGYWGYRGGSYGFYNGYWGPTVGFYGGINYGYGYGGRGYYGGQWAGNTFRYNTAVTRVNATVIQNTYVNRNFANTGSRAGFNGPGGAKARPTTQEQAAAKAKHIPPTSAQRSRVEAAKKDPALHARNNKGKPSSDAVTAFNRSNGRQAATGPERSGGAQKQAGVQKQANAEKRTSAGKTKGGTARTANPSHPTAQAGRIPKKAGPPAGQSSQVKQSSRTNKKVAPSQAAQRRQPPVSHRPPTKRTVQAPPSGRGGAPARAEQPGKKKKKKHGEEGPGGGR